MPLWLKDLMSVTEEVTIHRPNVSTLLSSAFIRGDLNAVTRGPFIRLLISCLFFWRGVNGRQEVSRHYHDKCFFFAKENRFLMLFQTCTKLTFGLSDVFVLFVTVIARNRINGAGSCSFVTGSLGLAKICPKVLSSFNVVAIQNYLDGFRNTLNVRNNSKASRWFSFIRNANSCNWFLAVTVKSFCIAIRNIFSLLSLRIKWRWWTVSPPE